MLKAGNWLPMEFCAQPGIFWTVQVGKLVFVRKRRMPQVQAATMRKFFSFIWAIFMDRRKPTDRRHLLGMYFGESNSTGRRKSNRDRS
jgi:hypothetical protein